MKNKTFVIGSMSCADEIRKVAEYLMSTGCEVEYVRPQPNKNLSELIVEAYKHISESDDIIAIPKSDGSFGTGTMYELGFAEFLGKRIFKWRDERNELS